MKQSDNPIPEHVFLQVSIAGAPPQTIVILLFQKQVPKTCANFVALLSCHNQKEATTTTTTIRTTSRQHPHPTYRGCEFHRIIDKFMVQGGDFERFDGTGGYSPLYQNSTTNSGGTFDDESFGISHKQAGIVSMANAGPHTNKSQFFITLQATPHLDKKHVAFGQVVQGMDVVQHMTSVELDPKDRPVSMQRIVISDCGIGCGNKEKDDNALSGDDKDSVQEKERVKKKKSSKKSSKKHSKRRHGSSSDDSRDEEEQRRKKRHKKHSRDYTSSSDDEDSHQRRRKKHKKRDRHRHRHDDGSSSDDDNDRRKKRKHGSESSSKH
jgi:peptidyl-prolyl isomerase G (cyclophilin G)